MTKSTIEDDRQMIFTAKLVDDATDKLNDGVILKRWQNPWLKGEVGLKRAGVIYQWTNDEIDEFARCADDIEYFAEKYCKIKTDDGSIACIKLREYQKTILDTFDKSRFTILMASRQIGKTVTTSIFMLHTILFNPDKNIMIVANKGDTAVEIIDKIKNIYTLLPFFLKPGIKIWNQKSISFDNGCRIKTSARTKTPAIGFTLDIVYLDEFAHIPSNIIEPYYTAVYPTVSAMKNSKIIITSTPNGMNLFYKLLTEAELPNGDPKKNNYKALRVYWYQVPGRFVTYIRLNDFMLQDEGVTKEYIFDEVKKRFGDITKVEMYYNIDKGKYTINVYNNEKCKDTDVKAMTYINYKGHEMPISKIAELATWKEDAMKDIGGEDGFNQEFGLRFINASKSLLSEYIIDDMIKNQKNFIYKEIDSFTEKLKMPYDDLRWIDDSTIFNESLRKKYKIIISVDLSEGLGQDNSVINIFRIKEKDKTLMEQQIPSYKTLTDFFSLVQIGIYINNITSIKNMAELLYMIIFDYFNPDNVKCVVEYNTYGSTLFAEMPHVFNDNNDYGSHVFFKYKHNIETDVEKLGLRVGQNKGLLVKDYQERVEKKDVMIYNEQTIREMTTFVKMTTSAGNIKYAADTGHDDCAMSVIDMITCFSKPIYFTMVSEYMDDMVNDDLKRFINDALNKTNYDGVYVDYKDIFSVKHTLTRRYITPQKKMW